MCLKFNVELAFSVVENKAEREVPACGWAVTVKYAADSKVRFFSKVGQIRPFPLYKSHRPELNLSSVTLEK
jgi:hypothetical protein